MQQHLLSVYVPANGTLDGKRSLCYCKPSFLNMFDLIEKDAKNCFGQVYITHWGLHHCTYASFQGPGTLSLPQIALATVPGSGNTWSRSLVQRLTGVLSGSVFKDPEVFHRALVGEMDEWSLGGTTFIKNHFFNFFGNESIHTQNWKKFSKGVKLFIFQLIL